MSCQIIEIQSKLRTLVPASWLAPRKQSEEDQEEVNDVQVESHSSQNVVVNGELSAVSSHDELGVVDDVNAEEDSHEEVDWVVNKR